jgi:hypothetical protein
MERKYDEIKERYQLLKNKEVEEKQVRAGENQN